MYVVQYLSKPEVAVSTSSLLQMISLGLDGYTSEAFEKFIEFQNEVEKQSGKSIKTLRSDQGGEYLSTEFTQFIKDNGILAQLTPPYTP